MCVRKNLRWNAVWQLTRRSLPFVIVCHTAVCFLYGPLNIHWLDIPWQPVALLGTAVAFYIGFRSNGSYDRFWEGRQLWATIGKSTCCASKAWTCASCWAKSNCRPKPKPWTTCYIK